MKTVIYTHSDDLIELAGGIEGEIDAYHSKKKILCSDGTMGLIYTGRSNSIEIKKRGFLFEKHIKGNENDLPHTDEDAVKYEVSSYQDALVLLPGIEWIKIGNKTFNR